MKRLKKLLPLLLALMFVVVAIPTFGSEAATAGWKKQKSGQYVTGWKYQLSNGRYVNNCVCQIDGKYYLFKKNGMLQTGATSSLGYCYYEGQQMSTGVSKNGVTKYNKDQGAFRNNIIGKWEVDKKGYFFTVLTHGKKSYPKNVTLFINDNAYTFNKSGYLTKNGKIVKPGTYKITWKKASHSLYKVNSKGQISKVTNMIWEHKYTVLSK